MLYIYVAYAIISVLLLAFLHQGSREEKLLAAVVVTLLPVVGWSFALVWPKGLVRNDGDAFGQYMARLDEDILIKGEEIFEKVNKKKEIDVVAIEEALLLNDHATRRQIMIDVLKDDSARFMDVIKTAVENEDTETSHYAVSAIMEVKRKLSLTIRRLSAEFERNPSDLKTACEYRDALKQYMDSGFMDENTLRVHRSEYIDVLRTIISAHDGDAGNEYEEKMRTEMELADYMEAEQTGLAYLARHPDREGPYLQLIRLYYTINSPADLERMIQAIKDSQVMLTNHGLKIVRYWSKGKYAHEESKLR